MYLIYQNGEVCISCPITFTEGLVKLLEKNADTAELTFNGAVAYPVGPLDKGVDNVVGIVLTYSRLTVGLLAAAFMTRAVREAKKYSEFHNAFGLTI
jgi:hypothetical protein